MGVASIDADTASGMYSVDLHPLSCTATHLTPDRCMVFAQSPAWVDVRLSAGRYVTRELTQIPTSYVIAAVVAYGVRSTTTPVLFLFRPTLYSSILIYERSRL